MRYSFKEDWRRDDSTWTKDSVSKQAVWLSVLTVSISFYLWNSLEDKYVGDELVQAYNIYVEAMFRQAVDSSFLKKIKMESGE